MHTLKRMVGRLTYLLWLPCYLVLLVLSTILTISGILYILGFLYLGRWPKLFTPGTEYNEPYPVAWDYIANLDTIVQITLLGREL